ncbi:MAG: hypothetical protein L6Q71_01420 [Planctomycetes bacterium]|nr:hypothetical protein [Planctomycetota bacterium]
MNVTHHTARGFIAAAIVLAGGIAPAGADTREQTYTIKANEKLVVGSFYEIDTRFCKSIATPKITIKEEPKSGKLIVEEIRRKPIQQDCASAQIPAMQITYQAGPGAGADTFAYSISYQSSNLGTWHRSGKVTVTP